MSRLRVLLLCLLLCTCVAEQVWAQSAKVRLAITGMT